MEDEKVETTEDNSESLVIDRKGLERLKSFFFF